MKPIPKIRSFLPLASAIAAMLTAQAGHAQTVQWGNTGSSTAWYTNTNWSPNTSSAQWLTTNVAQFNNTGTATTAGINMGTASLSIGAIEVGSARTRALTIGNSSGTVGTLTLNGATVNSVNNVILRNASNSLLTLQNNETGSGKTMNVALGNATNNIIQINGSGGVTISSNISGTNRQLSRQGSGTGSLTLSGNNTFSGGITHNGSAVLALQHSNAAGTGTINIASTRISTDTAAILTLAGGINVANDLVIDSASGRNTINSITSGSNTLSGDITINNNGSSNQIVFQNQVNSSTFTIGAATPNSTTLTATTYAGSLSFRAGTSTTNAVGVINSQINAPNASFNLNNNGVWTVNSTGNSWAATTLSTAGSRVILGSNDALATGARIDTGSVAASVNLNGFNQSVAGLAGTSSDAQIFNDSTTSGSTLTLAALAADRSFSGAITDGSGGRQTSLVVNNSNAFIQTLAGANTFKGTTTVSEGTLNLANNLALQNSALVTTGAGTVSLGAGITTPSFGGLSGATGDLSSVISSGYDGVTALTLNPQSGSVTYGGVISNGAANMILTKTGLGTQTLSGTNTYTGDTLITQGVLQIGNGGTTGTLGGSSSTSSNTSISSGAELRINRSGTGYDYYGVLSGSGTVNIIGGSRMNFRTVANQNSSGNLSFRVDGTLGINTSSGVTSVHLGELSGSGTIQRSGTASGAATISIGGKDTGSIFSGTINSNELAVEKVGSGTLTLEGANTYTGTTLVSAGTLLVNGSLGTTAVTVDPLAIIGGTGALGGSLSFAGDSFLEVVNPSDALAVTGTITFGSGFGIANLLGISWDDLTLNTPYTVLSTNQTFDESDIANFGLANAVDVGNGDRQAYFTNGSLAVIVIPEPRAALLGSIGLLILLRRRRG